MHAANACNFMRKNDDRCIFGDCKKAHFFSRKKKYEGCEFHFSLSYFENMVLAFFVEKQKVGCISASFVVKDGQDIFGYILRIVQIWVTVVCDLAFFLAYHLLKALRKKRRQSRQSQKKKYSSQGTFKLSSTVQSKKQLQFMSFFQTQKMVHTWYNLRTKFILIFMF